MKIALLLSSILLTGGLQASVDPGRITGPWVAKKVPEAMTTQLAPLGVECLGFFAIPDSKATMTLTSKKTEQPYTLEFYLGVSSGLKESFQRRAKDNLSIRKNELVEKDGLQLFQQELKHGDRISVILNQIGPGSIDQVILNFPEKDYESMVSAGYGMFLPVPAPGPDAVRTASEKSSAAFETGRVLGDAAVSAVTVGAVLVGLGAIFFSKKRKKA